MAEQGMSYSVGQVAGFAGVTVRTLHFYDRAGAAVTERAQPGICADAERGVEG